MFGAAGLHVVVGVNKTGPAETAPPVERPGMDDTLVGVDISTGRMLWRSRQAPNAASSIIVQDRSAAAVLLRWADIDADETLHIHDMDSGREIGSVRLGTSGAVSSFSIAGDAVLVSLVDDPAFYVFDRATGRLRWQRTAERAQEPFWLCGNTICHMIGGWDAPRGMEGLDLRTGRRRWFLDGWTGFFELGDRHLLAAKVDGSERLALVDVDSGAVVRPVGRWKAFTAGGWPRFLAWQLDADGSTALLAQVDATSGEVAVFGRLKETYESPRCEIDGPVLVCAGLRGLSVWRLPA